MKICLSSVSSSVSSSDLNAALFKQYRDFDLSIADFSRTPDPHRREDTRRMRGQRPIGRGSHEAFEARRGDF
jgi:hypothetical protein